MIGNWGLPRPTSGFSLMQVRDKDKTATSSAIHRRFFPDTGAGVSTVLKSIPGAAVALCAHQQCLPFHVSRRPSVFHAATATVFRLRNPFTQRVS